MTGRGDEVREAGRDVAMQAAAMNPVATTRDEVPAEVRDKELEIGREAARAEGKPEHILDRIAEGKLERYFKDNVLVEQPFVKDASQTVKQMLESVGTDVVRFGYRASLNNGPARPLDSLTSRTTFTELEPRDAEEAARWAENRERAYRGSSRHLLRALIHDEMLEHLVPV
jgi:hypothetical protein